MSPTANPYIGLRPFDDTESHLFFGRHEQTVELLELLHQTHFLAVVGSSGCGKSSLVRAGVIPDLVGGFLVAHRHLWHIARMKPGDSPLENLARALCEISGQGDSAPGDSREHGGKEGDIREIDGDAVEVLLQVLVDGPAKAVMAHVPGLRDEANLLVLVDQFEEIFTFCGSGDEESLAELSPVERRQRRRHQGEAADFVDLLLELTEDHELPIYVILTMRSDFLGDCDVFSGLPEAMNRSQYLVPRLGRDQLHQAIVDPARFAGAELAPRLRDRLLNEPGDRTDRLPVLQHALLRTWDAWQRGGGKGPIDFRHYEEIGCMRGAISQHAEVALRESDSALAKQIFKCLVDTDPGHRRVRRPASVSELVAVSGTERETVEALLERFRQDGRNFLTAPESDERRVQISHESLIRQWGRLKKWVDEEREERDQFRDLVQRARTFEKGKGGLLRGLDLETKRKFWATQQPLETWSKRYRQREDDFEAAERYYERSLKATKKRQRRIESAAVVVLVSVLTGLTGWALIRQGQAKESQVQAEDSMRVAVAREWLGKDPTTAALVLLEVERPAERAYAAMREVLKRRLAELELRGPRSSVIEASFSPDGRRLVTVYEDGTAWVWSVDAPVDPLVLEEHDGSIVVASFSPDGRQVVTAASDGTARVWSLDVPGDQLVLKGHLKRVLATSFSPDGKRVVTASSDGTARVWTLAAPGDPLILGGREGHDRPVVAASFSPDGTQVVTASRDRTARVWSLDEPSDPLVLEGHDRHVVAASFSPDGSRVVTASLDGTARVWTLAAPGDPLVLQGPTGQSLYAASFLPDGRVLTASRDDTALWTVKAPTPRYVDASPGPFVLNSCPGGVTTSVSLDHSRVVTACADSTDAWVLNVETLEGYGSGVVAASLSPGGKRLVTAYADGTARVWSLDPAPEVLVLKGQGPESEVLAASFSSDGRVLTASEDGRAQAWSLTATFNPSVLKGHGRPVVAASFSLDGGRMVTVHENGIARVWSFDAPTTSAMLEGHGEDILAASFSPDGNRVVAVSSDGTVRVWSLNASSDPIVLEAEKVIAASFSPDGRQVVTASWDGMARIWSLDASGDPIMLADHRGEVVAASFSPDGRQVVTASWDSTARVWSLDAPGAPAVLVGHADGVLAASFSPDGKQVVTASWDHTARVWSLDAPGDPAVVLEHDDVVTAASFSADGKQILTVSRTARVWGSPDEELRAKIRAATRICLLPEFREKYFDETAERARRSFEDCERASQAP